MSKKNRKYKAGKQIIAHTPQAKEGITKYVFDFDVSANSAVSMSEEEIVNYVNVYKDKTHHINGVPKSELLIAFQDIRNYEGVKHAVDIIKSGKVVICEQTPPSVASIKTVTQILAKDFNKVSSKTIDIETAIEHLNDHENYSASPLLGAALRRLELEL